MVAGAKSYIPDCGDLVWLDFGPQAGQGQEGKRPALVMSPKAYNGKTGMLVACQLSNQAKGYPFEVQLPAGAGVNGVILADHVTHLDWRARDAKLIAKADVEQLIEVRGLLKALLEIK